MAIYAATIFLSAFLLFQVQPLIAKMILPWFGGSAAVWSASLLFFQLVLLAGYAYAHLSIRYLKPRVQGILHVSLLVASCLLLPILPSPTWRPTAAVDPTARILGLLTATIGLPYLLLSSTSPLLQAWFVRRTGSAVPYRLFALSNFGSMLALVSFPFLVEPNLATRMQAYSWSGGYGLFVLVCAYAAWASRNEAAVPTVTEGLASVTLETSPTAPRFWDLAFWVLLAAAASILLISVTNHMSENVAPIPLLWVLPLALYLLTFILAFESDRIYRRWIFMPLLFPALGGMAYMLYANEKNLSIQWAVPGFAAALFVCCMFCHGELARRRPAPHHLTLFYLMVSLGGALGGVFVALIAPRVFDIYLELPLVMAACGVLAAIASWHLLEPKTSNFNRVFVMVAILTGAAFVNFYHAFETARSAPRFVALGIPVAVVALGVIALAVSWTSLKSVIFRIFEAASFSGVGILGGYFAKDAFTFILAKMVGLHLLAPYWFAPAIVLCWIGAWYYLSRRTFWPLHVFTFLGIGLLAGYFIQQEQLLKKNVTLRERNFYGPLEVRDDLSTEDYAQRTLLHGTINHGSQSLDPVLKYVTTSYYGKRSGVGRAITALQAAGPIRAGFIGLGSGVLSNYGRKGDYIRVYEINPLIERIAQTLFTFYPHSPADKAILMGDARLTLENQLAHGSQSYDLIAVDAFSSDAIPVHLLTREATQLYFKHLKPNGVLALHISNRYLDLKPVCERDAAAVGRSAWVVEDEGDQAPYFSSSTWVLVTSDTALLSADAFKDAYSYPAAAKKDFRPWTDDYSNLFQILSIRK